MSNNKSYLVKVEHDTNSFDLMNMVNKVLMDAGTELQFVIEEKENNSDNTYINYSFVASGKLIQE